MDFKAIEKGYIHASIEKNNGVRLEVNGDVNGKHIFVLIDGLLSMLKHEGVGFNDVSQILMQSFERIYKDDMKSLVNMFAEDEDTMKDKN